MMKTNKISALALLICLFTGLLLVSCNEGGNSKMQPYKMTVLCDDAIYDMMKPICEKYDSLSPELTIELVRVSGYKAMVDFLTGKNSVVIISRNYTKQEDSLIKAYKVNPVQMWFAKDALVFYTYFENPIDSLVDNQVQSIFTENKPVKSYVTALKEEPVIVCPANYSSEYYNFMSLIIKDKKLTKQMKTFSTSDSVMKYVESNRNTIGIGYLSEVIRGGKIKAIPVSFTDSTGTYISTNIVHQSGIVQGFYPYIVYHYIYVYDINTSSNMEFARYLCNNSDAQMHYKECGIVPNVKMINLIKED
jgi:ABC-type phosphate transport system substrate-binding protein